MPTAFSSILKTLAASLVAGAAVLSLPAAAQDAAPAEAPAAAEVSPDTVLATVGGEDITEADLNFAAEDLAQDLQQIPPAQRRAFLLTVMIDMKVMANAAREQGLDQSEVFARRLAYLEDRALRRAFFADVIEGAVSPEAVQTAYDEAAAQFEPQTEVRARHILVESEEEANSIAEEIAGGMAFEQAAMAYSTDGSSANGGDLGYFSEGMMVQPFEEAAFALEVGQVSEPVQSQFGWHLIKLEDRRETAMPPLEQVQGQLAQQVLYQVFEDTVGELKANTEIEITDEDLAAAIEAQGGL
ncbi:peptidylprolyl isomerase [Pelagibacterium xiamenense]|uniref:peptidylprolyl isomerase n=1 Tax=Pelagibacterium xiamenense TaxID=2901140 RepID=UPI001E2C0E9B|nr:peptidylprolyl isomerase [Pelagibacterium xiamenense]MCD7061256.1 peptidylprolyl isomerase [Pelagibacterium xiamenense]